MPRVKYDHAQIIADHKLLADAGIANKNIAIKFKMPYQSLMQILLKEQTRALEEAKIMVRKERAEKQNEDKMFNDLFGYE